MKLRNSALDIISMTTKWQFYTGLKMLSLAVELIARYLSNDLASHVTIDIV